MVRYGGLTVKSRVHARQLPFLLLITLELEICKHGCPYSIHISKIPLFGASVDPLW